MKAPGRGVFVLGLACLLAAPSVGAGQEADYPTRPPPALEPRDVEFPQVGRDTLDNGMELVVVENHEQPVVSVRLYLPAGEVADPEGKVGLANLTASMLDRGAGDRSATEIAEAVEGAGASLSTGASDDYAFVATSVLSRRLSGVLDVLAEVVRDPTFPAEEFANEKERRRSSLQQELGQPDALASRRFRKVVYGSHPYAEEPTPASVQEIRRTDLVAFHRERYTPRGSLLVFAGDVDLEGARRAARERFGDWSGEPAPDVSMPEPPEPDSFAIDLVHRPGSAQSAIRVGHLGLVPGSEDRYAVDVMNRILGGGPASRLFLTLREEKGWTYGAYSRFVDARHRAHFVVSASVRSPVTDSTLAETLRQLRRIRREPVAERELRDAKSYLVGHFPLEIETPQQVASRVADVLLRGLEIDYLETYRQRVAAVDREAVRSAARTHLWPDRADAVVVGDARRVREGLSAIGPVTVRDTDGEVLDPSDLEPSRGDASLEMGRVRLGSFTYDLRARGSSAGTMSLMVDRAGEDRYRVRQETSAAGFSQSVRYTVTPDLSPLSVSTEGRMGAATVGRELTYEGNRVRGSATVPARGAGGGAPDTRDVEVDTTLASGTLDDSMNLAAVLASPLASGFGVELPVYSPRAGVRRLEARVTGSETVTVPAGEFETWVVEVTGTGQAVTLHVSRSTPRMLVRQQIAGQPVTLELEEVGGEAGGGG